MHHYYVEPQHYPNDVIKYLVIRELLDDPDSWRPWLWFPTLVEAQCFAYVTNEEELQNQRNKEYQDKINDEIACAEAMAESCKPSEPTEIIPF